MVGLDWALVVLVVYPLAQIPLVLYLARWFELDGDAPLSTPTRAYWTGQAADEGNSGPTVLRPGTCPECGTVNDPGFAYCRNCVAPIA